MFLPLQVHSFPASWLQWEKDPKHPEEARAFLTAWRFYPQGSTEPRRISAKSEIIFVSVQESSFTDKNSLKESKWENNTFAAFKLPQKFGKQLLKRWRLLRLPSNPFSPFPNCNLVLFTSWKNPTAPVGCWGDAALVIVQIHTKTWPLPRRTFYHPLINLFLILEAGIINGCLFWL